MYWKLSLHCYYIYTTQSLHYAHRENVYFLIIEALINTSFKP